MNTGYIGVILVNTGYIFMVHLYCPRYGWVPALLKNHTVEILPNFFLFEKLFLFFISVCLSQMGEWSEMINL